SVHRGVPEGIRGPCGLRSVMAERENASEGAAGRQERQSQAIRTRYEKLEALRRRGIEPYAYRFEVSAGTADARAAFEAAEAAGTLEEGLGPADRLGGRLVALRSHGKTVFADLADRQGRIQVYFRQDDLGLE